MSLWPSANKVRQKWRSFFVLEVNNNLKVIFNHNKKGIYLIS